MRNILNLFLFLTLLMLGKAKSSEINVVLISPSPKMPGFWQQYEQAMQAASKDLDIRLSIVRSIGTDRFEHLSTIRQAINVEDKPDYLVTMPREATTEKMFSLLESSGVKYFLTNTQVPSAIRQKIGYPTERFKNWIGHLRPDDLHAGRLLSEELWRITQSSLKDKTIKYIAVTGARDNPAVFQRNKGLEYSLRKKRYSRLHQFIFTDWRYQTALEKVSMFVRRYPDINIVWCASDEIAAGVIDGYRGLSHSEPPYIGGIDWSVDGIERFQQGSLSVLIGGHLVEGALILALIRDHHDGFKLERTTDLDLELQMSALGTDNFAFVHSLIVRKQWQTLDFTKLSQSFGGTPENWASDYLTIMQNIERR